MKKVLTLLVLALLASAPQSAHATNDGTPSTGSFTIVNVSSLSATNATGLLTVLDTASLAGTFVHIGPYTLLAGRDFLVGTSSNASAVNLAAAINAYPGTSNGPWPSMPVTAIAYSTTNTVSLTAIDVGTYYNGAQLLTSNSAEISVGAATLAGGQNNASVTIAAVSLIQGRDWFVQDVASNTALSLQAAINSSGGLRNIVSGYWVGNGVGVNLSSGTVYLRSLLTPTAYPISAADNSANQSNILVSNPTMTGGASGNLAKIVCDIGIVNALPTSNYPPGCKAQLASAPWDTYLSTQAVTSAGSWQVVVSSGQTR